MTPLSKPSLSTIPHASNRKNKPPGATEGRSIALNVWKIDKEFVGLTKDCQPHSHAHLGLAVLLLLCRCYCSLRIVIVVVQILPVLLVGKLTLVI